MVTDGRREIPLEPAETIVLSKTVCNDEVLGQRKSGPGSIP